MGEKYAFEKDQSLALFVISYAILASHEKRENHP